MSNVFKAFQVSPAQLADLAGTWRSRSARCDLQFIVVIARFSLWHAACPKEIRAEPDEVARRTKTRARSSEAGARLFRAQSQRGRQRGRYRPMANHGREDPLHGAGNVRGPAMAGCR